jgi:hypothetical protein
MPELDSASSVLGLCHGGPVLEPAETEYVLRHARGVIGFFGAWSIERLPTEVAITNWCAGSTGKTGGGRGWVPAASTAPGRGPPGRRGPLRQSRR